MVRGAFVVAGPSAEPGQSDYFWIDLPAAIAQHRVMTNDTSDPDSSSGLTRLFRWATTPPQAYVVYVLALIMIYGVTFIAGTLAPKKHLTVTPDSVSVPAK